MEFHRGRLVDHVQLVVSDFWASRKFYAAVLDVLGIPIQFDGDGWFQVDELFVNKGEPTTGRTHLGFQAKDRETVDRFYKAGLTAGGKDNGKPGERDYHPGYYAAYLLDPDGNNIEAVYHGPATRSAESVVVTAEM